MHLTAGDAHRRLQEPWTGLVRRPATGSKSKVRALREKQGMLPASRLAASFSKRS